ncbi:Esterase D/formylglutathione hydrolase [Planoprotostelium fungivorum]|uniref:S-formylglutathione hydrolase n=1 Tax=Planoprotostelium fungivorum TaxID=1890364 RepID=A0A2P6NAZ1_9EUKA|nr:Esterase D/formylglutathione hydrolase [Planoprotostelium fungivorum]
MDYNIPFYYDALQVRPTPKLPSDKDKAEEHNHHVRPKDTIYSNCIWGNSNEIVKESRYSHVSRETKTEMTFTVFMPSQAKKSKAPAIWYLSGLTCNDENFIQKAGAQREAAHYGFVLISPDTSPRGAGVEGETESWDLGVGAGFYVDATTPKWTNNYRMYSYIHHELWDIVKSHFPIIEDKQAIMGHSMGGHGALTAALKNPGKFVSASAFAPISNPSQCPWGEKAFNAYLGQDKEAWKEYDSTELVRQYNGPLLHLLVDQGTEDKFYKEKQLLTENLQQAAATNEKTRVEINLREGYDHSYFFVSTFIPNHFLFHSKILIG